MTIPSQCRWCKRLTATMKCEAFPEQIPEPILLGEHDHRKPYPGDNGLRYVPRDEDEE